MFPLRLRSFKIWLNDNNVLGSADVFQEIFEEKHHTKLKSFLGKKDKVIVDLGANEGLYVLKMKENSPNAKIIAVEPNPEAFRILKKNVETNNLSDVMLVNSAVSSKNGKVNFEIIKGSTEVGALKLYEKFENRGEIRKISVTSITLEKLFNMFNLNKIDLLKMDVEGTELEILKSAESILPKIKKVVVEYHGAQKTKKGVIKLMLKRNFKMLLMEKNKFFGDVYFINKSALS
jgi:FkbM family methyltransferase